MRIGDLEVTHSKGLEVRHMVRIVDIYCTPAGTVHAATTLDAAEDFENIAQR